MDNVDFLPEDYLHRKAQQRTNLLCLVLFFTVTAGVIAAFVVTEKRHAETLDLRDQVNSEFAEASKRLKQLKTMESQRATMMRKAEVTATLLERVPRSFLMAEITNSLPAGVSLIDFEMKTQVKKMPRQVKKQSKYEKRKRRKRGRNKVEEQKDEVEIPITEVLLELTGLAATDVQVAQFIATLGRSSLFEEIGLAFSEESKLEDELLRKFRVMIRIHSDADVSSRTSHSSLFGSGPRTVKPLVVSETESTTEDNQ